MEKRNRAVEPPVARWVHRWAVFTACVTVIALTSGAIVTTFRVGMADPIWPTYPWHLALISWKEPVPGFVIEHSHRLADYILGVCVIVLAVLLWRYEPRRWLRWLGAGALAGVIAQGVLGGFRVVFHALVGNDLAFLHGCFAQLVFGLLVSVALFTSRGWTATVPVSQALGEVRKLRRWSLAVTAVIYLQLVFGAVVRHMDSRLGPRGHLLVAFAVVAGVVWLARMISERARGERPITRAASVLMLLVALQLLLGVEAWMIRFSAGFLPEMQRITISQGVVRTLHFLLGSLIFADAVVITLLAYRRSALAVQASPTAVGALEGAA